MLIRCALKNETQYSNNCFEWTKVNQLKFQTTIQTVTETADATYALAQSNKANVDSLSDKIDVLSSKVGNYLSDASSSVYTGCRTLMVIL